MLRGIIDLIIADSEAEKKRRAKLTRWERFKEDFPDNILCLAVMLFGLFIFGFLPVYGFYHLIM